MLESRRRRPLGPLERLLPLLLLAISACALPGGPPIPEIAAEINSTLTRGKYVVGPGDLIQVSFRDVMERNHSVTVRADGWASFTGIDDIQVAGLTLEQLDARLTDAYGRVLAAGASELTPQLVTSGRHWVTVMGEVDQAGQLTLEPDGRLTLVEAIGKAGGFNKATAHLSNTLLVRWDGKSQRQVAWKIDARPRYWDSPEPIFLQAYDVVFIPNTPVDKVGIWIDMYIRRMIPFPYLIPAPTQ